MAQGTYRAAGTVYGFTEDKGGHFQITPATDTVFQCIGLISMCTFQKCGDMIEFWTLWSAVLADSEGILSLTHPAWMWSHWKKKVHCQMTTHFQETYVVYKDDSHMQIVSQFHLRSDSQQIMHWWRCHIIRQLFCLVDTANCFAILAQVKNIAIYNIPGRKRLLNFKKDILCCANKSVQNWYYKCFKRCTRWLLSLTAFKGPAAKLQKLGLWVGPLFNDQVWSNWSRLSQPDSCWC